CNTSLSRVMYYLTSVQRQLPTPTLFPYTTLFRSVYGPTGNLIPIGNVLNKGITIRANQTSVKRLLPRLMEHVQNGVLNPKEIITHRIPLQDVADAYRIFSDKLDGCIKPLLIT